MNIPVIPLLELLLKNFPPQPLIECFINNVKVTALIDTGSMVSILSKSVFDKLPDKHLLRRSDSNTFISITGQSLHSQGDIPFLICDNVLPI